MSEPTEEPTPSEIAIYNEMVKACRAISVILQSIPGDEKLKGATLTHFVASVITMPFESTPRERLSMFLDALMDHPEVKDAKLRIVDPTVVVVQ